MDAVFAALTEGATVVTANKRLARSISLAFHQRQRAAARVAWRSPIILSWQAWIEALWWSSVAAGGGAGRHMLLTDFQARILWRETVRVTDSTLWAGAASPLADLAARAWRLSLDWRLSPDRLAETADSEDTRTFAAWAADFRKHCEAECWADSGLAIPLLASDIQSGIVCPPRGVHFVGFEEWTPLQREFLRVLEGAGCTLREEPPPLAGASDACRVACHDRRSELDCAARWARQQAEQSPSLAVGIVVPDLANRCSEVRRAFLDIFAPDWRLSPDAEFPINFSYAEPIADTGMFRAAFVALRALAGSLDYREAGLMLRTPYLAGSQAEAGGRAGLDLWLREQPGLQADLPGLARRAATLAPALASRLQQLAHVAASRPRRQGAAAWAETFRAALEAVGWPGDRPLARDEYQAGHACQGLWSGLRGCDRFAGPLTLDDALGLLDRLAHDQLFQPAGHPEAVQVLGTLEALGQHFDALWICGLTSEAWPAAVRPNPLLPLAVQRELKMPDSSPPATRQRAERILRWLQASAPTVVVSWPEFAGEEPLTASPLTDHLPRRAVDELGLRQTRRRVEELAGMPGTEVVQLDPPPPVDRANRLHGGSALLEREARCPARAFLQFRLGAQELSSPAPGIDPGTRGSITHAVLNEFFQRVRNHDQLCRLSGADEHSLLDAIITAVFGRHLPSAPPLLRLIAENERARLHQLLGRFLEAERQRPGFEVLWTEQMPAVRSFPPAISALQVRLRPDRVDALPDGGILIIDYKTGRDIPGAKEIWGPRPKAPQLPLYATLANADGIAFVHLAAGPVIWMGIGRESWGIRGIREPSAFTRDAVADWEALRSSWWTALERLAEEILAGSFDVDRWHRDDASGQWAMATRVHELTDNEESEI